MAERIKLTITEVSPVETIKGKEGKSDYPKLTFKATKESGETLTYFTFSKTIIPHIAPGKVVDVEVDTTTNTHNDTTYTNRKVTQLYENGQAVGGAGGQRQGGNWQQRPDNSASIEMQTAAKIAGELLAAKIITPDEALGKAVMGWCLKRLSGGATTQSKVEPSKSEPDDFDKTFPAKEVKTAGPLFANAGAFMSRAHAEYQLTATQVYSNMTVSKLINQGKLADAWAELEKAVRK